MLQNASEIKKCSPIIKMKPSNLLMIIVKARWGNAVLKMKNVKTLHSCLIALARQPSAVHKLVLPADCSEEPGQIKNH